MFLEAKNMASKRTKLFGDGYTHHESGIVDGDRQLARVDEVPIQECNLAGHKYETVEQPIGVRTSFRSLGP